MLPYLRLHLLYPRSGGVSLSPRDITAPGQPPPRSPRPEKCESRVNQELAKFTGQLTQSFNERFDRLEKKVDGKADGERVYRTLDGIAKRLDDDGAERAAIQSQLDRHERWHHQAADKLDLDLEY